MQKHVAVMGLGTRWSPLCDAGTFPSEGHLITWSRQMISHSYREQLLQP